MNRDQLLAAISVAGHVNPANILTEEQVLSKILNEHNEFTRLYENERQKIRREIFWYLNPFLTSNLRTEPIIGEKNNTLGYIINIKYPVLDTMDAINTAYEIIHIIRTEQGFTGLISLTPAAAAGPHAGFLHNIASALESMFSGPLTNMLLAPYGFDLWTFYDKLSSIQRHQLEPVTKEPEHPLEKLYQITFYVQKALDWEVACLVSSRETNNFISWYEAKYPIISTEAKEIIEWIKKTGYDTAGKARRILKELIRKYDAGAYITVK